MKLKRYGSRNHKFVANLLLTVPVFLFLMLFSDYE
nr:MAG TPA: hypothetical protein [Caudoviricetes sp.]